MTSTPFEPRRFLKHLTQAPGIYQMFDQQDRILYVGKAKNLKNRLSSYFRPTHQLHPKTQALVARIANIEVTLTHNEIEALLLEQNLIKALKPPFNILLRDDKSYPFLHFSAHPWPALTIQRVRQERGPGEWFGPYPNAASVREMIQLLYRTFRLRQCDDATFHNRSRPCLQYQIQRCSAPCTGEISSADYQRDLQHARLLLQGKDHELTQSLADQMEAAAAELDFESAALFRDQIQQLRQMQQEQHVDTGLGEVDVFALEVQDQRTCVTLLQLRQGRLLATRHFRFKDPLEALPAARLQAFIAQHFLVRSPLAPAPELLISPALAEEDQDALQTSLSHHFERKIKISSQVRSQRARWLDLARANALEQLNSEARQEQQHHQRFASLEAALKLEQKLERIECFDISHSHGEATVASCVVFDRQGPRRQDYRRFNIHDITPGDDYAAMAQALARRYRAPHADDASAAPQPEDQKQRPWPDLLILDGGKGQLNAARDYFAAQGLTGAFHLLGVAKGTTRKAGLETLYFETPEQELVLPSHSPALHLIQHIRDESHRVAIQAHRQKRDKKRTQSALEDIPGIGPKRRQALLRHFGGIKAIEAASLDALCQVEGISRGLAEDIRARLNPKNHSLK